MPSRIQKAVQAGYKSWKAATTPLEHSGAVPEDPKAGEHNAYVSEPLNLMGVYDTRIGDGILDKTGVTMLALRNLSTRFTPVNAIISTRVNQAVRFCQRGSTSRYGLIEEPSFRIRLRDREAEPSREDLLNIRAWEDFFENAGWCPPPEEERPIGWQRGLDYVMKTSGRDTFTIDFVPFKIFPQKGQEKQFPVVSFCTDDGAQFRNVVGEKCLNANGTVDIVPWEGHRKNFPGSGKGPSKRVTRVVRLTGDGGFMALSEYTAAEVSMFIRNPRADEYALGYGYPETEQAVTSLIDALKIRDYNSLRFEKDRLPRGFFKLQGNVSQTNQRQFENRILQMMTANRWSIPILRIDPPGQGQAPTDVDWVDITQQLKDGEYPQLAYQVLTELHAAFHISLEETGLAAANPNPQGLSEPSPEHQIVHSQSHLVNMMVDYSIFFNREILWRSEGGKAYQFEWVGLEDRDYMQEEQLAGIMLQNGTVTTRELYQARDKKLPKAIENDPAVDLPMPYAQARAYLDSREQAALDAEMAEQQQTEQAAAGETQYRKARPGGADGPSTVPSGGGGQSGPPQPPGPQNGPQGPQDDQGQPPQGLTPDQSIIVNRPPPPGSV